LQADPSLYKLQNASKLIDKDTLMLNNRIALLKNEEDRIFRKMEAARKRAGEIVKIKQNNEEKFERRVRIEVEREFTVIENRTKVQKYREERKRDAIERAQSMLGRNQELVTVIKSQSRQNDKTFSIMKQDY
jgi:hypothetical protein